MAFSCAPMVPCKNRKISGANSSLPIRGRMRFIVTCCVERMAWMTQRSVGDKEALLASARYPKIEFTFTEEEQKLAEAEMEMLVDVGQISRKAPLSSFFAM